VDALNYLNQDNDGFVLIIEQAHIDKYCHHISFPDICQAVSSLNKTVEAVMNWLGDRTDTAVIVTADHETGGLQISSEAGKYENTVELNGNTISYELRTTNHTTVNVAMYVYGVTADFTSSDLYKKKALKNTGIYYLMEEILVAGQG
jgi:alkaline phosphatase